MKLILFIVVFISTCFSSVSLGSALDDVSRVFTPQAFEQLKKNNSGKQWLVILWSVDCPPCFKELALVQELKARQNNLNVVIINADDNDDLAKERQQVISSYNLASLPNYHFADGEGDKARYAIDSQWYGELPRSYFVETNGNFHGKSGLLDKALMEHWLIDSKLARN